MINNSLKKITWRIVSAILFIVFFLNAYFYIIFPSMVFYPLEKIEVTPKDWLLDYEAVSLELEDKTKISGWYLPHPQAKKTVLFFHGNGGNISHRGDSIYIFHKLKLNVLIIDYAGYGASEGSASEKSLYQSADAAWDYLTSVKNIASEKIIIFGRSLGGAVAVNLAAKVKAGGIILESTFSSVRDVADLFLPVVSKVLYYRYSFDSLKKAHKLTSPVLYIHSPSDEIIPYQLGLKLYDGIVTDKTFLQINGGHNDGFMQSIGPYMQALAKFSQSI